MAAVAGALLHREALGAGGLGGGADFRQVIANRGARLAPRALRASASRRSARSLDWRSPILPDDGVGEDGTLALGSYGCFLITTPEGLAGARDSPFFRFSATERPRTMSTQPGSAGSTAPM